MSSGVGDASTFAAFFTRAHDQIRMASLSNASIRLSGSHAGCSIGADGPSQMALEDLAMMRAVHGSTVLYPCDANQTAALVEQMVDLAGVSYIRTTREKTPILYGPGESFPVGAARLVKRGNHDRAAVIAAGVTVHEAVKAYDKLRAEGIEIRILDAYTIKPIDKATLAETAKAVNGKLVTVEDHWPEGGLGDAVLEALAAQPMNDLRVVKLAVRDMPGSGTPAELMHAAGIDADAIVEAVKSLL
jgi:transketolase